MPVATFDSTVWPESIVQVLDENHLVVISDHADARRRFALTLTQQLDLMEQTQVISIDGRKCVDLPSFCRELETKLTIPSAARNSWWCDLHSVIAVLRSSSPGRRRRYLVWNDADTMLNADAVMFRRLVNALFAVAAETEYVSLDPVVLQRVVMLGGLKMGEYAEDDRSQFNRWLLEETDGTNDDPKESAFWEVQNVIERPPVLVYRLDA